MTKTELVKNYIMKEIREKRIAVGQRLPGCREISRILSVNKITVIKAYQALEEEHFLYCIPRGGYYVASSGLEEVPLLKTINFQTVQPDPTLIPYRAFSHAINWSIEEYKKNLFLYESPMGFIELRETLKERFAKDGIYASVPQIIITNGAQQGIMLALKAIFQAPSEGKLLVETPTYSAVLDMAKVLHIDYMVISRDFSGIDIKKLEQILKSGQIRAFYIIPRYHNPTGYSLSEKDKKTIAELCGLYQVTMIEDDYLADLGMDKRSQPLHYYDTKQLTVYIRSFSKTFLPGIRLGAMVVPEALCDSIAREKYLSDICTSGFTQGALNLFLKSGMYDKHIQKVNACYRRKLLRAKALLSSVDVAGLSYYVPKQGLFLWITLPSGSLSQRITERLAQSKILVSQWHTCSDEPQGIRLCIAGISEKDMDALKIILRIIKEETL